MNKAAEWTLADYAAECERLDKKVAATNAEIEALRREEAEPLVRARRSGLAGQIDSAHETRRDLYSKLAVARAEEKRTREAMVAASMRHAGTADGAEHEIGLAPALKTARQDATITKKKHEEAAKAFSKIRFDLDAAVAILSHLRRANGETLPPKYGSRFDAAYGVHRDFEIDPLPAPLGT